MFPPLDLYHTDLVQTSQKRGSLGPTVDDLDRDLFDPLEAQNKYHASAKEVVHQNVVALPRGAEKSPFTIAYPPKQILQVYMIHQSTAPTSYGVPTKKNRPAAGINPTRLAIVAHQLRFRP